METPNLDIMQRLSQDIAMRLARDEYATLKSEIDRLRSGIEGLIIKYSCRDIIKPEQIVSDLETLIGE